MTIAFVSAREGWRLVRYLKMSPQERRLHRVIPQQFVASLLQLGPTFIKIGQILSTRPDVLPQEYVDALESLQDDVPPFSFEEVQAVLGEELGRHPSEIFRSIEETPVAAASLSQVHFATLHDGTEVAVKVQRPGVRASIQEDMGVLSRMVRLAGRLFPRTVRNLNLVAGFDEFRRYTWQELDFSHEGRTIERFRANFLAYPDVIVPSVYESHTTPRVLTMSRVTGERLRDLTPTLPAAARRRLNARLLEIEIKMFVSDGLFHADLHPGNIFFQKDGKITLVDFGMYGEITTDQRDHFVLYFLAIIQKQTRRAFHHLVSLTRRLPDADEEAYYRRFEALANGFFRSTLSQTSLTQVYLQIILAGAKYGFVFPADLLLHAKAVTTAEALMLTLTPDLKFEEEARPSVIRHYVERAVDFSRIKSIIERTLPELLLFGELPPATARDATDHEELSERLWREVGLAMAKQAHIWEMSVELLPLAMKPLIRGTLKGRHTPPEIDDIVDRVKGHYRLLEPATPAQDTVGGDLMVHLAAFTVAMYRSLLDVGYPPEAATSVVYDVAWRAYTRMGDVPWLLSSKLGQEGYRRLEFSLDAFLTFPFSAPSYRWQRVDAGQGVYAFDMLRCPVAEYFQSHGLGDLCVKTWCNLDFPLARQWGGGLERTETLAGGGRRCDFRWRAQDRGRGDADGGIAARDSRGAGEKPAAPPVAVTDAVPHTATRPA